MSPRSDQLSPPAFASQQDFIRRLGDVRFWGPYVRQILRRHELFDPTRAPIAGINATYPTFLSGDVVVKLFGGHPPWLQGYHAERRAHELLAQYPEIKAPRLLAHGHLLPGADATWPYLITSRVAGVASSRAELSAEQKSALVEELGWQVRYLHALPPPGATHNDDWQPVTIAEAAARSSLPAHLAEQAEAYVAAIEPHDRVFVHADLCANHVFVEDGRLAGIIDWGDAMVTDRHCELIQVYRDALGCDKALFGAFLEASAWPMGPDFPHRTLAFALHRQAAGLTQHHTIDVFEPIAAKVPLQDVATLDDLAIELFAL